MEVVYKKKLITLFFTCPLSYDKFQTPLLMNLLGKKKKNLKLPLELKLNWHLK